jgi:putative NADPH-quinone reductase
MNVLVVIGHPNSGSFCHAIAEAAVQQLEGDGHEVVFHDLCAEGFDPLLPHAEIPRDATPTPEIQRHCDELRAADGVLVVHPNWWAQPPAILKGWVDRVFRQGVAYDFGEGGSIRGYLGEKTALVITTSNTPRDVELERYGDPLQNLWQTCIFDFCGIGRFERRNFESIVMSTLEQRRQWLAEVRQLVSRSFP